MESVDLTERRLTLNGANLELVEAAPPKPKIKKDGPPIPLPKGKPLSEFNVGDF